MEDANLNVCSGTDFGVDEMALVCADENDESSCECVYSGELASSADDLTDGCACRGFGNAVQGVVSDTSDAVLALI